MDDALLDVEGGEALAVKGFADTFRKKWFPRELLWYYGIEALEKDMESA